MITAAPWIELTHFVTEEYELGFNENQMHPNRLYAEGRCRIERVLERGNYFPAILHFKPTTGLYENNRGVFARFSVSYILCSKN